MSKKIAVFLRSGQRLHEGDEVLNLVKGRWEPVADISDSGEPKYTNSNLIYRRRMIEEVSTRRRNGYIIVNDRKHSIVYLVTDEKQPVIIAMWYCVEEGKNTEALMSSAYYKSVETIEHLNEIQKTHPIVTS